MHQHLEQRVQRERALRVQRVHQALERQILMRVGVERSLAHSRDDLAQGRVAGQVVAQHDRVDEEADEFRQRGLVAARDRRAERDVVPGTEPRQQHRDRRLSTMNSLAPVSRANSTSPARTSGDTVNGTVAPRADATAGRLRSRSTVVSSGTPVELLTPVVDLVLALGLEHVALPQRVVGVLDRQRFLPPRRGCRRVGPRTRSAGHRTAPAPTIRRRRCGG